MGEALLNQRERSRRYLHFTVLIVAVILYVFPLALLDVLKNHTNPLAGTDLQIQLLFSAIDQVLRAS